jgi:nucleoside-diphosphate-sugar epimerase
MKDVTRVLVLGGGYTGTRVALLARARGLTVEASARRDVDALRLASLGLEVFLTPSLDEQIAERVDARTHVVVTFPPDGVTDARVAPCLGNAGAVTYVSSTAVYGELRGHIDDSTEVPAPTAANRTRLEAEDLYRRAGGTVLRCPGIYGPDRGLHVRVVRGDYRLPGDGSFTLSRIHVEDLAAFVLAAPGARGETFVVGDLAPVTHQAIVRWLCETYGVPFPSSVPVEDVHPTLRADRAVDGERARRVLGVKLSYPTYREGMAPAATGLHAR